MIKLANQLIDEPVPPENLQDQLAIQKTQIEAANAKLRRQAGTWLRAELERWTRYLETATPEGRQIVSSTLKHWQTDTDLAGLRY